MDSLLYGDKPLSCMISDDKDHPLVRFTELEKGNRVSDEKLSNRILFLLSGRVEYGLEGNEPHLINGGVMLYVPPNVPASLTVVERCRIVMIYIEEWVELYECFEEEEESYSDEPDTLPDGILEIHPRILLYLTNFSIYHQDGMQNKYYLRLKVKELFYLIRGYYENTRIRKFFSLLREEDRNFSNKILQNWQHFRSVRQLAEFMNCSESAFTRKFKTVFGENAGHWLTTKRKEAIFHDLTVGQEPLKVLAEKHLFSTQGLFCDFCKNNFGKAPGKIRKHKEMTVFSEK